MPLPSDELSRVTKALTGKLAVERELGRGGMATVYLARDAKHHRLVAVKVLRAEVAAAIGVERFLREIQIAAGLSHPHIMPLYDSGKAASFLYYVMPYLEGESLRDRLRREPMLPVEEAVRLAREIAGALAYAHAQGIVHRDIKPENVLLQAGHAVVTDFGIARAITIAGGTGITGTGVTLGTPLYMSPEQITGDTIDGRSDVYSLGCVAYEMLCGAPPHGGATPLAVIASHAVDPVTPLHQRRAEVPPTVARAVTTALAKSPGDRFPTAAAFDAALAGTAEATAPRRRWTLPAAIGVGALALAVAGYAVATRRSASDKSIAVLPLVNQSRVEEDQIRSDGMTEALIDALSQVQGLRVPSRTEVYATSTAGLDSREIGARLHVATLLEGSYEPVGDLLQVTVRLVNAGDGSVVWSNMFRRNRRDVFAVQDEISQAVTNALRVRLGGGPRTPPRATASLEAYDLYLKGRWYWNQRGIGSAPMRRAIDYFNQAIALDSNYAQAWAGLADVYSLLPAFGDAPPADAFAAAKRAALRALALDSNLAEAHTSLGIISVFHDWEWTTAAREFDRALALDSMEPRQHLFHAWYYVSQGRLDDALREVQTAQRLNPVSPIVNARVGDVLMYMGRLDEAAAELRQAIALDSSNVTARAVLGRALTQSGRFDEAIATFPPQLDIEAGRFGGIKAYALGRAGRQAEARAVTRRLSQIARQRYIDPIAFAYAAIGVGDTASALTSIEQALREHSFFMLFLAVDPPFASLHANPRYLAIVREVGLTFPPHPAR